MSDITSMAHLQDLVRSGFTDWRSLGDVYAKYKEGLVLFNYSPEAQYAGRWNYFERVSRGLILDAETGDIVARPFDKFFNWGEGERTTDAPLVNVTEKMDGSLGIAYMWRGKWHVATRGSFDSEQAQWATEWLRPRVEDISRNKVTLLFEIIYPENRVVVDYGDRAELVLLAARDLVTGQYAQRKTLVDIGEIWSLSVVPTYQASKPEDLVALCATLDANQEGYVAEFADGQRFKFKGEQYKALHRLISGLSFKNTLDAVANGKVDEVRAAIPDEFLGQFNQWVDEIESRHNSICKAVELGFEMAPKGDRKEFAIWANKHQATIAPYLFTKLDGRDYAPLIYRREFKP